MILLVKKKGGSWRETRRSCRCHARVPCAARLDGLHILCKDSNDCMTRDCGFLSIQAGQDKVLPEHTVPPSSMLAKKIMVFGAYALPASTMMGLPRASRLAKLVFPGHAVSPTIHAGHNNDLCAARAYSFPKHPCWPR